MTVNWHNDNLAASVIIPTRNRSQSLERFLPSLAEQDLFEPYEIIVIDNGSTDATPKVVEKMASRWSHIRMISEPRPGGGRARHAGAMAAQSPLLVFVDDDMWAEPRLLAEHLQIHKETPGGVVIGNIISAPGKHPFERMMAYIYDGPKSKLKEIEITPLHFWSGNGSMARALYLRTGGYSEIFAELRCGEDLFIGKFLNDAGVTAYFAENAITYHHFSERFSPRLNRAYRQGVAMAYVKMNYPELLPRITELAYRKRWQSLFIEVLCRLGARVMEPLDFGESVPMGPLSFIYDLGLRNATQRGMLDYFAGHSPYKLNSDKRVVVNTNFE